MTKRTIGGAWLWTTAMLVTSAAVGSCGARQEGPDTSSHWLETCTGDDACGAEQACLCGVCTKVCTRTSECQTFQDEARCVEVSGCSAQAVCALETTFEGSEANEGPAALGNDGADASELPDVDAGSVIETSEGIATLPRDSDSTEAPAPSCLGEPGCPWSQRNPMPLHSRGHAAVAHDGLIYVVGGWAAEELEYENGNTAFPIQATRSSLLVLDPTTDVWTTKSPLLAPPHVTAHSLGDAIYVLGGEGGLEVGNAVYRYLPEDDVWTERARMPTVRGAAQTAALHDRIFVFGGEAPPGEDRSQIVGATELDIYDPMTDSWSQGTPAPYAVLIGASCASNNRVFAFGGYFGSTTLIYDPDSDAWSDGAPPLTARNSHSCVVVGDSVFLLGGVDNQVGDVQRVERYDISEDSWEEFEPMPTPRSVFGATALGSDVYVFGGRFTGNGDATNYFGLSNAVEVLSVPSE